MSAKSNRLKRQVRQLSAQLDTVRESHWIGLRKVVDLQCEINKLNARLGQLGHAGRNDALGGWEVRMQVGEHAARKMGPVEWHALALHMVKQIQKELAK